MPPTITAAPRAATTAIDEELCSVCKDLPFSEFEEYFFPSESPDAIDAKRREFERLEFRISPEISQPLVGLPLMSTYCQLLSQGT
jgi:hypothetical protein